MKNATLWNLVPHCASIRVLWWQKKSHVYTQQPGWWITRLKKLQNIARTPQNLTPFYYWPDPERIERGKVTKKETNRNEQNYLLFQSDLVLAYSQKYSRLRQPLSSNFKINSIDPLYKTFLWICLNLNTMSLKNRLKTVIWSHLRSFVVRYLIHEATKLPRYIIDLPCSLSFSGGVS